MIWICNPRNFTVLKFKLNYLKPQKENKNVG